jgi:hypothetical protein
MLTALMEIIREVFIAVMFALCIVLIVVVSNLPDDNPLKRVLTALGYRIGATLVAGAVAIPVEPIPGLHVLYDLGAPIALIWYWFTFFRGTLHTARATQMAGLNAQLALLCPGRSDAAGVHSTSNRGIPAPGTL